MPIKIGLLATARKKRSYPAPVVEFYTSPLFRKSVQYAFQNYDRIYFYNAKDGLLQPEQIMEPYDVSIKTFTLEEKKEWAQGVVSAFRYFESPEQITVYLHGGYVYRKFLQPELTRYGFHFRVPLKGLGIGKQLSWYDEHIKSDD
ncbi:MAG TPA: hypothetical protein VFK33_12135 [Bacillales bacterium]|nr:hypothetical protein [Bacillales bacterium]